MLNQVSSTGLILADFVLDWCVVNGRESIK